MFEQMEGVGERRLNMNGSRDKEMDDPILDNTDYNRAEQTALFALVMSGMALALAMHLYMSK